MKRIIAILAVVLLIIGISSTTAFADDGGYSITNYKFTGTLHENNTVTVTENITVNFTSDRHGIYREIPLYMYVGGAVDGRPGTSIEYSNDVKDVSVEGWKYSVDEDEDGRYEMIKIGSSSKYVSGEQNYVIHYTYVMPDDRLDSTDFLFYSVLGSEWNVPVDKFSFDLKFDKAISKKAAENLQIYSGSHGGEYNYLDVDFKATTKGISGSVKNVGSNQAVTIFGKLPQGYFVGAKTVSPIPMYLCFGVICLAAVLAILFGLTAKKGEIVETVEFYPPEGMTPAEVGTIIDESADDIDLMSLIPYWAQKGYITINEIKPKKKVQLILNKVQPLPADAPQYQKVLFNALFKSGEECNLSKLGNSFADSFSSAKASLKNIFRGPKTLSVGHGKALLLCVLAVLGLFGFITFSSPIKPAYNFFEGIVISFPVTLFAMVTVVGLRSRFKKVTGKIAFVLISIILLGISSAVIHFALTEENLAPEVMLYAALALAAITPIFACRIVHNTEYRNQMLGKLNGLKNFIETAEIDRLKYLLEQDPGYYYEVLPYAMAFGMLDKWSKRFDGLTVQRPYWYSSYDSMTMWELYYLNRMLKTNINDRIGHINAAAAAAKAASAASSSGGGGFSGGGGGGGGGGSW